MSDRFLKASRNLNRPGGGTATMDRPSTEALRNAIALLSEDDMAKAENAFRAAGLRDAPAASAGHQARRDWLQEAVAKLAGRIGDGRVTLDRFGLSDIIGRLTGRFCGIPDETGGDLTFQNFGAPKGRWLRGNLSVAINPAGCTLPAATVRQTILQAFGAYAAASAAAPGGVPFFTFTPAAPGGPANINVQFGGSNLSASLSQEPGGALGVGFPPPNGNLFLLADAGLPNRASGAPPFVWTQPLLLALALHEIGHVLGLSHSSTATSVMYPFAPGTGVLDAETIRAIRSIYGWTPQIRYGDRASTHGPATALTSLVNFTSRADTAVAVWKGAKNDTAIYWAESARGQDWGAQQVVPNVGTSEAPALAAIPGVPESSLMMAWKGIPGDNALYVAQKGATSGWQAQAKVPNVGSSHGPGLAFFNNQVYLAWKGVPGDSGIYWTTRAGNGWAPQRGPIQGRGTSHSPSLIVHQGRLLMFWKGIEGDSNVFFAELVDPGNGIWGPQAMVTFIDAGNLGSGQSRVPIGSSEGPNALVHNGELVLIWKGVPGDTGIYFSRMDATREFSGQVQIPNVGSSARPSAFSMGGSLFALWRGTGDTNLYSSRLG